MNPFTTLKRELADRLREALGPEIEVVEEFPAARYRPRPDRRMVAVGLSGVELPGAGQTARLTLRFDILCPGGDRTGCHAVFEALCGALCGLSGFGKLSCGEVSYLRELDRLGCAAFAELAGFLQSGPAEDGERYREVIISRKGE